MNEVFRQTGEFTHLTPYTPGQEANPVPCLAACEDQTHEFLISESVYPNRSAIKVLELSF